MEQKNYSEINLLQFLRQSAVSGLINPSTSLSRKKAAEQLLTQLNTIERQDLRQLDVDELCSRFHKLHTLNPQQQFPVSWPSEPVVAQAYLDQLERSGDMSDPQMAELTDVLTRSASQLEKSTTDEELAAQLHSLTSTVAKGGGDTLTNKGRAAWGENLEGIAARLR